MKWLAVAIIVASLILGGAVTYSASQGDADRHGQEATEPQSDAADRTADAAERAADAAVADCKRAARRDTEANEDPWAQVAAGAECEAFR